MLHFIAGNLHAIKELNILLNPSINSYKRLVPGYEAPTYLAWGAKNRSTAIRIPEVTKQDHEAKVMVHQHALNLDLLMQAVIHTLPFCDYHFAGLEGKNKAVPNTEKIYTMSHKRN